MCAILRHKHWVFNTLSDRLRRCQILLQNEIWNLYKGQILLRWQHFCAVESSKIKICKQSANCLCSWYRYCFKHEHTSKVSCHFETETFVLLICFVRNKKFDTETFRNQSSKLIDALHKMSNATPNQRPRKSNCEQFFVCLTTKIYFDTSRTNIGISSSVQSVCKIV